MARYDWTPFFSAVNGAIDDYSERQQYAGLLGGGTNGANPATSGLLSGVDPAQLAMLRRLPPKVGMKMLGELMKPDEYGTTPQYNSDGTGFVLSKSGKMKPLAGVKARDKAENINGVAVNMYDQKPGTVLPQDITQPFVRGSNGAAISNAPVQDYQMSLRQAGRPVTSVNVNTQRTYAGAMADNMAKQDAALLDAGRGAPKRIQTAQEVLRILDTENPMTGTAADFRLSLNKAFATAGLTDGKSVAPTENLMALLNQQTLDAVKSSGLGSGQGFTDKDRQFLQDAASGRISWNKESLRRAAHLAEKAGFAAITQSNKVAGRIKGNPDFGSVGQDLEVQAPKPYGPQRTPAASAAPIQIKDEAGYNALPSGAVYIDPNGQQRTKQ